MTRSAEFASTMKGGIRSAQPDLVVHARLRGDHSECAVSGPSTGQPRIGFVVSKTVGNAVQRHRVARRLRHAAVGLVTHLQPGDCVVVRALPGCRDATFPELEHQLATALRRLHSGSRR